MTKEFDKLVADGCDLIVYFAPSISMRRGTGGDIDNAVSHFVTALNQASKQGLAYTIAASIDEWVIEMERILQSTHSLPIVLFWEFRNGVTVVGIDLYFDTPNAPFSHNAGVKH